MLKIKPKLSHLCCKKFTPDMIKHYILSIRNPELEAKILEEMEKNKIKLKTRIDQSF